MINSVEGRSDASGLHIGLAVSKWNQAITDRLLAGAVARCEELNAAHVTVITVSGALELPVAAQALVRAGCDAVVAIGAVIRGDTDHYDVVVRESSAGIARVALENGVPVANAILAAHDYSQAVERSSPAQGNRGADAVDAAVATATALQGLSQV